MSEPAAPRMPEIPRNQRIVLAFANGMHQIAGHSDQFEGQPPVVISLRQPVSQALEDAANGITPNPVSFGLSKAHPKYLLYKETANPTGLGTFDRSQK